MFDTTLSAPDEPADDWSDATADWPVLMAEHMGPCGEALNLLAGVNPNGLSKAARVSALAQLAAIGAHHEAAVARMTAAVAGPEPADPREDWGTHDVSAASRCSLGSADQRVAFSRDLAGRLSATLTALTEGRISYQQARLLSQATAHLSDEIAQEIEANMLRFAYRQDLTKFKLALRRWLARLDPDFAARAKAARAEVDVRHNALDDGTGELYIRGPLELTATIDSALNGYAAANKSRHGGTIAGRKLAGLVQWAETYLTSPDAPRRHGRTIGLSLCFDPPTMFGMAQHPAEIPGYGMVPAEAALHLLAAGSPLRKLIIDPDDGHLLYYGRTTYVVPPPLTDHLIALHISSAAPHSAVPAAGCDMDHNLPFGDDGTTDPDNTAPLDRRWHRAKTHAGWTWVKNEDASITWASPTGHTYRVDPHDYRLGP
jgi:hypothetical protein